MHETEAGVECDVLNIYNGIDVCVDTIFPMNEEYEETHFNANPDVHDYMQNEFHTQSLGVPPFNVSSSHPPPMLPPQRVPSSHHSTNRPNVGGTSSALVSVQCGTSSSLHIGSSCYMNIESGSSESEVIEVGYVYDNKQELQSKLHLLAVDYNFEFKIVCLSVMRFVVYKIIVLGKSVLEGFLVQVSCLG